MSLEIAQIEMLICEMEARYTPQSGHTSAPRNSPVGRSSGTCLFILPDTEANYFAHQQLLCKTKVNTDLACFVRTVPAGFNTYHGRIYMCAEEAGTPDRIEILQKLSLYDQLQLFEPSFTLMKAIADWQDNIPLIRILIQAMAMKIPVKFIFAKRQVFRAEKGRQRWQTLQDELLAIGVEIEFLEVQNAASMHCTSEKKSKGDSEGLSAQENYVSKKLLILEDDINNLYQSGQRDLDCPRHCIITPLALDRARELEITINRPLL